MHNRAALIGALVFAMVAVAVPCGAQGVGNSCDISGTWYGGSDPQYQYVWSLTPVGAGRYYSSIQNGYDVRPFGMVSASAWVGEAIKTGHKTFDTYNMSFWLWDPAAAAAAGLDPSLPEVDIVHSRVEFIDCNTFTSTIDVFGAYYSFTPARTPFVTPLDADFLAGGTIVETYHRMPTTLAGFQPAVGAAGASTALAVKAPQPPTAAFLALEKRR